MKKTIVLIVLLYCGTLQAQKNQFPQISNVKEFKAGDIITKLGTSKNKYYKTYKKKIPTTYGTIVVKENRIKPDSRLITLPIKKLHSFSENPKEPVFLLNGGPGSANIRSADFIWLLEKHDIVMVGYRGIDGSVSLQCPEIPVAMILTDGSPLGEENMKRLSKASLDAFNRLESEGIDVDAYNMIEVIDDLEAARNALGYEKINLFGLSYGTRVAYLYGLRHPESIQRTFLEGVNPPGCFVWEPDNIDNLFTYLGEQWKKYPECVAKSPDIIKTIKNVLASLPVKWKKVTVNPDKVKFMTFMMSMSRNGFAQTFEAFVAAENGDYSGLAFLSMAFDQIPYFGINFGDQFSKALSADFESNRNYLVEMEPEGSLIGAPYSKIFAVSSNGGWPITSIPDKYKKLQKSNVQTLMLSGSIDISTPPQNGTKMLEYLPNGHQVILMDRGHEDTGALQKEAYHTLVNTFFQTGKIDDSGFSDVPIDFNNPKPSLQKIGKLFYKLDRLHLTGLVMKMMR